MRKSPAVRSSSARLRCGFRLRLLHDLSPSFRSLTFCLFSILPSRQASSPRSPPRPHKLSYHALAPSVQSRLPPLFLNFDIELRWIRKDRPSSASYPNRADIRRKSHYVGDSARHWASQSRCKRVLLRLPRVYFRFGCMGPRLRCWLPAQLVQARRLSLEDVAPLERSVGYG